MGRGVWAWLGVVEVGDIVCGLVGEEKGGRNVEWLR